MSLIQPYKLYNFRLRLVFDELTGRVAAIARNHKNEIRGETTWPQELTLMALFVYCWADLGTELFGELTTTGSLDLDRTFNSGELERLGFRRKELESAYDSDHESN